MLARARERLDGLTNVQLYELSDVSLARFADVSFDFVYATTVLMHLDKEDLYQYVLEAWRILKPGGWAFFDTWNLLHPDTYRMWEQSQRDNVGASKTRGRIQFSTAAEIRKYLESAGFSVERLDEDRLIRAFARRGPEPLANPDDGLAPFGVVDSPRNASVLKGDLQVWGWAMDDVDRVEVFLDGNRSLGVAACGTARPDLVPLFPRYPGAASAGFGLTVPAAEIPTGEHKLQVRVRDRQGRVVADGEAPSSGGGGEPRQEFRVVGHLDRAGQMVESQSQGQGSVLVRCGRSHGHAWPRGRWAGRVARGSPCGPSGTR